MKKPTMNHLRVMKSSFAEIMELLQKPATSWEGNPFMPIAVVDRCLAIITEESLRLAMIIQYEECEDKEEAS